MILLPLLVFANQAPIIELNRLNANYVTVQAVCKLPALDPLGNAAVDLLAKTITSDNDYFSKAEMAALCIPVGEPRCSAMPDHLWLRLSVLPADAAAGVRMMAAIVRSARIAPEAIAELLETEPFRARSVWSLALDSAPRAWSQIKHADVEALRQLIMRPENVTVAVGGPIVQVAAQIAWTEATADWEVVKRPRRLRPLRDLLPLGAAKGKETAVIEFAGQKSVAHPEFAQNLLALVALGSGKGSSLFRVVRQELGASYRQEAALFPSSEGLIPRLLMQTKVDANLVETAATIKRALIVDVEAWNGATLARAKGHATGSLEGGPMNPFYFHSNTTTGSSLDDEVFLAAYWKATTGENWNPAQIVQQMEAVDLKQLKSLARALIEESELIIHGS